MALNNPPSGFVVYPSGTLSSSAAFALTAGYKVKTVTSPNELFPMNGAQGIQLAIGATLSAGDNDACDYRIWTVDYTYGQDGLVSGLKQDFFGSGTATFSAADYIGAVAAGATGRMADTLTFAIGTSATTPKGNGDIILAAYDSPAVQVYSPGNDTPAHIIIPRMGWCDGIIIEFDSTTGDPLGLFSLIARK